MSAESGNLGAARSSAMLRELHAALRGGLKGAAGNVVLPDTSVGGMDAQALLRPDSLRKSLAALGAAYADPDPRALGSIWSAWYFGMLTAPALAACLRLDAPPSLDLPDVWFGLAEKGHVCAVGFRRSDPALAALSVAERLSAFVGGHLQAVIEALAEHTGLSRNVLWGNAAGHWIWCVRALREGGAGPELAEAASFMERPSLICGAANPLRGRIQMIGVEGNEIARRRTCCLRYLLPGVPTCGAVCPLPASVCSRAA